MHVDDNQFKFTCAFANSMGLPCRHIFAAQASQELEPFEVPMVKERWTKCYQGVSDDLSITDDFAMVSNENSHGVLQTQLLPNKQIFTTTLSRSRKYRKGIDLGQKLATAASVCGMAEFEEKYHSLEHILALWKANISFVIAPKEESKEVLLYSKVTLI